VLLVFTKFQEVGSVRQTLLWFLEHDLQLPVKTVDGDTRWKRPQYQTVHRILTNPAYAGAYAYGRTEHSTRYEEGKPRKASRRKARQQWLSLIPNTHEGYITWDQFERVQLAIGENMRGREHSGAVQSGSALLWADGLWHCQPCNQSLWHSYGTRSVRDGRGDGIKTVTAVLPCNYRKQHLGGSTTAHLQDPGWPSEPVQE